MNYPISTIEDRAGVEISLLFDHISWAYTMISLDERGLLSLIESAVSIDCIIFFVKTQASSHWDKIIVEHVLAYGASSI